MPAPPPEVLELKDIFAASINLTAAMIGVLGAVLATVVAGYVASQSARQQRTMALHAELSSSEMYSIRIDGFDFAIAHQTSTLQDFALIEGYSDKSKGLWQLLDFYQRVAVSLRHKQVLPKETVELFAEIYVWWYKGVFERKLTDVPPAHRGLKADLEYLYEEFGRLLRRYSPGKWDQYHCDVWNDPRLQKSKPEETL